ncbi:MAG: hypothetical protein ABJE47_02805 [bacterium]
MFPSRSSRPPHPRHGTALVIALALLILGSALLAGSSASAHAASRAVRSLEAVVVANAEARAEAARFIATWSGSAAALPVGGELVTTSAPKTGGIGALPIVSSTRLRRITATRYVLSVECLVGPVGAPLAARRVRVILGQVSPADTTALAGPPVPISRWAIGDLF